MGVATGETCDDAVDRAIARIAQQIEVRVNATEQRRSLYNAVNAVGGAESTSLESEVHLVTDATLLGVEIVETLPLPNGSCAARAALEIDRSIALYDGAIEQRDSEIGASLARADGADTPWAEFVAVAQAMSLALDRDILAMTRGVLAARGARAHRAVSLAAPGLIGRYEALRAMISLSVVPIGACPPEFVTSAESALTRRGLPVERDHPGAIQLRIGWQALAEQTYDPRWWACRWRLSVTLYDAGQGETIASRTPGGAAYGLGKEAAVDQSQSDAGSALTESVDIVLRRPGASSNHESGDTIHSTQSKESPQ